MDIASVIQDLNDWRHNINFDSDNPYITDAIQGSIYETGWRGTVEEYLDGQVSRIDTIKSLSMRAIHRIKQLASMDIPKTNPISPLSDCIMGLGTYGWKYNPDIIHTAIELGVDFIDTAETYGYGKVETELGLSLIGHDVAVISKMSRSHMSFTAVGNAYHRSIAKLGIPRLLSYQIHRPNIKYPLMDTIEALKHFMDLGLIESIGVCNFSVDMIEAARYYASPYGIGSVQMRYNLMDRGIEHILLPYCQALNIPVIAYSPLGQDFNKLLIADGKNVLGKLANYYGVTKAMIALAWLHTHMGVIPIPRTNNAVHLMELMDSRSIDLDASDCYALETAFPLRIK